MNRLFRALLAAVAGSSLLAACGGGGDNAPADLANTTRSMANAQTMVRAMDSAGMTSVMKDASALTLLAPTDEALAPYAEEMADLQRPENRAALEDFLKAHVIDGKVFAQQLQDAARAQASSTPDRERAQSGGGASFVIRNLLGEELEVSLVGDRLFINGAELARIDIRAINGVLHQLSAPLYRPTVFSIVKRLPQTSTLEAALRAADLQDTLRGPGPFTLFAPSNQAFDKLLKDLKLSAAQLLANKPLLTQVLTYHVLASRELAREFDNGQTAVTVQGQAVTVATSGKRHKPSITLTDARGRSAKVVDADIRARNGVVHLIDSVILPSDRTLVQIAQGNPDFSILVEAVVAAGLVETLSSPGPFTVFAPTNGAFAALLDELKVTKEQLLTNKPLLTAVLTYHVLGGQRVLAGDLKDGLAAATVNGQPIVFDLDGGAKITDALNRSAGIAATNIQASNGVIHVIDKVILPTANNLVQVALGNPAFSILVEAVVAAGLVDALSGPGPFTVFAPTNDAFAALLGELKVTKDQLLANKPLLTKVLTYHVVPAQVLSSGIPFGTPVTSLQGQTFTIDRSLKLTDANGRQAGIVATDVAAVNGVVHVIDRVILPK